MNCSALKPPAWHPNFSSVLIDTASAIPLKCPTHEPEDGPQMEVGRDVFFRRLFMPRMTAGSGSLRKDLATDPAGEIRSVKHLLRLDGEEVVAEARYPEGGPPAYFWNGEPAGSLALNQTA
jgi:hypothetical protein